MQGASRAAAATAAERLEAVLDSDRDAGSRESLSDALFTVTGLLDRELSLRRVLADPSVDGERKAALAEAVIGQQLGAGVLALVQDLVRERWSRPHDLADTFEELAVTAAFAAAEAAGVLDDVEDQLFRLGRVVAREPALRAALSDPRLPLERKLAVVDTLLAGRAHHLTRTLVERLVRAPRGRSLEQALEDYAALAARRRERIVADVTTAVPLSPDQAERLAAVLGRIYGRRTALQASVDPAVRGGVVVRVGDELIDGTVATRLALAARGLTGR
jgi:F-type H+-transporting ATPase subunit delta